MNDVLLPANFLDISATDPDPQALGRRLASRLQHDLRSSGQESLSVLQRLSQDMGRTHLSSRIAIYWFIKQITISLMNCLIGGHRSDSVTSWRILSAAFDVAIKLDDKNLNRELIKLLSDVAIYKSTVFDPNCSPQACAKFLKSCTGDIVTEEFKRLSQNGKLDAAWNLISLYPSDSPSWDALHTLIDMDKAADPTYLLNNVCDVYTRWTRSEKNPAAIPLLLWDRMLASNVSSTGTHFTPTFSSIFHYDISPESILCARRRMSEDKNLLAFLYILYVTLSSCPNQIPSIYGPFPRRFPQRPQDMTSKKFIEVTSVLCIFALFFGENQFSNTVRVLGEWVKNPGSELAHLYVLIEGITNITVMMQRSNRPANYYIMLQELYGILYKVICEQPSALDEFRSKLKFVLSSSQNFACFHILGPWYLELISPNSSAGSDSLMLAQNLSLITGIVNPNGDSIGGQKELVPILSSVLSQLVNWIRSPNGIEDCALDEICRAFSTLCTSCLRAGDNEAFRLSKELFNLQQEWLISTRPRVRLILPSILSAVPDLPYFVACAQTTEFKLLGIFVNCLFEVVEPSFGVELRRKLLAFNGCSHLEILPHLSVLEFPDHQEWVQSRILLLKNIVELIFSCYQKPSFSVNMNRQMTYSEIFVDILRIWNSVSRDVKPAERFIVCSTTAQMLSSLLQSCTPIIYWKNNPQYLVMMINRLMETADTLKTPQKYIGSAFDAIAQLDFLEGRRLTILATELFQSYLLCLSAEDWSHCLHFLQSRNRVAFLQYVFQKILLPVLNSAIFSGHDCIGAQRGRRVLDIFCKLGFLDSECNQIVVAICRILQQQNYQYLHSYSVISMHALSLSFLLSRMGPRFSGSLADPDVVRWIIYLCLDDFRLISLKFADHFPIKRNSVMVDKSVLISEINANRIALHQHGALAIAKLSRSHYPMHNDVFAEPDRMSNVSFSTPLWDVIPALVTLVFQTLYAYRQMWIEPGHVVDYLLRTVTLCTRNLEVVEDLTVERSAYQHFISSFTQFCSYLPIELENNRIVPEFLKLRQGSALSCFFLANHLI